MPRTVADALWSMLQQAGVRRCYGIVGDALNPVIDALRRNGAIEFVHVRHEEYGVFAAVADSYLREAPVAVCGTAGPGTAHLINGLLDARKERAAVITIAGDVETSVMDTSALEELNPYKFFDVAALYIGRVVTAEQAPAVFRTAITTAVVEKGPTVISLPGDVAGAKLEMDGRPISLPGRPVFRPSDGDLDRLGSMIGVAENVTIFGGEGCRDAREEVIELARRLNAPIGYSFRGKQWLEYDNPLAVGMTGLLGYGGAYKAMQEADLVLFLGTDFPFTDFLPGGSVQKVQVDVRANHIGRRVPIDLGLVADVKDTIGTLLPSIEDRSEHAFLDKYIDETRHFRDRLRHYVERGPLIKPIRPEFLTACLNELAAPDAMFFLDTGTPCIWGARYLEGGPERRIFGSFTWASMASAAPNAFGAQLAYPGRQTIALCGDGGFSMLALGDLATQVERSARVVQIILNNSSLDFVNIEQQEAGFVPFGTKFKNPNFARVAEAMGAKGIRLETPDEVRDALREALAWEDGPVVVDAVVDPFALSLPSHIPAHTVKGFTLSFAKQVLTGDIESVIQTVERNLHLV